MSGLCGWVGYSCSQEQSRQILSEMAALFAIDPSRPPTLFTSHANALAYLPVGRNGTSWENEDMFAVIVGHPRLNDARLTQIVKQNGITSAVVTGYKEYGFDVLNNLYGDYSLALVHKRDQTAFFAVDRYAINPLTYALVDGCLVFASSAQLLKAHPKITTRVDNQAIYNYLHFHVIPAPGCIYHGLKRLLPGQYASFSKGELTLDTYWKAEYSENTRTSFTDLKHQFIQLLEQSVHRCAVNGNVGAFLSGGTDSSSIAGMLGRATKKPAKTYSIGFHATGYDEIQYARVTAKHFGTEHHEYYVTPDDVVSVIPTIAASYSNPFGNASAVPTYYCARMAKQDGIDILLGGDGGDELFAGNSRYAAQWIFSLYGRLPQSLRKSFIEPFAFTFPAGDKVWPINKLRSYIRQANIPMPKRLETYNFFSRLGIENIFTSEFLENIDTNQPQVLLGSFYNDAQTDSMLMLIHP